MEKLLKKSFVLLIVAIFAMMLLQFPVKAAEDDTNIVKTADEYLIYKQEFLEENFKFAFAKDKNINEQELNFINSLQDNEGNNIAYVNEEIYNSCFLDSKSYMWIQKNNEIVVKAEEVNLGNAITQENINYVSNTTKRIATEISEESREEEIDGVTKTTKVDTLNIIPEEGYTYEYQIVKPQEGSKYAEFFALSEEIAKITEDTNSYENIMKLNDFYNLYNALIPTEWEKVENNQIKEPEDTQTGEKYLIWLKATNASGEEITDVQFMTCEREENKEYIPEVIEKTTTVKLPVTFDFNMVLWILFAILVIAIIVLLIVRSKISDKKE